MSVLNWIKSFGKQVSELQSKSETFTVEGYNSLFRHFLARMRRKPKCYSKSMEKLELSIIVIDAIQKQ